MGLGGRIKFIRGEVSRPQFGKMIRVSQTAVQNYESFDKIPKGDVLLRIHSVFNVNINWLLTGVGDPYIYKKEGNEGLAPNTTHDINNSDRLPHNLLVDQFKQKDLARELNWTLLRLERADAANLREIKGYVDRMLTDYILKEESLDRRVDQRRKTEVSEREGTDRRTGTDRRVLEAGK